MGKSLPPPRTVLKPSPQLQPLRFITYLMKRSLNRRPYVSSRRRAHLPHLRLTPSTKLALPQVFTLVPLHRSLLTPCRSTPFPNENAKLCRKEMLIQVPFRKAPVVPYSPPPLSLYNRRCLPSVVLDLEWSLELLLHRPFFLLPRTQLFPERSNELLSVNILLAQRRRIGQTGVTSCVKQNVPDKPPDRVSLVVFTL